MRKAAAGIVTLSAAALLAFAVERDLRPSGRFVVPGLIAALVLAALYYLLTHPRVVQRFPFLEAIPGAAMSDERPGDIGPIQHVVTSHNQSGGITAHTVNVSNVQAPEVDYELIGRDESPLTALQGSPSAFLPDNFAEMFVTRLRLHIKGSHMPRRLAARVQCQDLETLTFGLDGGSGQLGSMDVQIGAGVGTIAMDAPSRPSYILNVLTRQPNSDIKVAVSAA